MIIVRDMKPFNPDEIKMTAKTKKTDKALGQDGFPLIAVKQTVNIIA